jgi:hypothetical protein
VAKKKLPRVGYYRQFCLQKIQYDEQAKYKAAKLPSIAALKIIFSRV